MRKPLKTITVFKTIETLDFVTGREDLLEIQGLNEEEQTERAKHASKYCMQEYLTLVTEGFTFVTTFKAEHKEYMLFSKLVQIEEDAPIPIE